MLSLLFHSWKICFVNEAGSNAEAVQNVQIRQAHEEDNESVLMQLK